MKYKFNDFSPKEAWLIFRVDFQVKDQLNGNNLTIENMDVWEQLLETYSNE
jgi:hypothetical protein